MTAVVYDEERVCMTVEGHADTAPYGEDLICAQITALTQMLALYIETESAGGEAAVTSGYASLRGTQTERILFDAVALAFECIAEQYPASVTFCRVG